MTDKKLPEGTRSTTVAEAERLNDMYNIVQRAMSEAAAKHQATPAEVVTVAVDLVARLCETCNIPTPKLMKIIDHYRARARRDVAPKVLN